MIAVLAIIPDVNPDKKTQAYNLGRYRTATVVRIEIQNRASVLRVTDSQVEIKISPVRLVMCSNYKSRLVLSLFTLWLDLVKYDSRDQFTGIVRMF